MMVFESNSLSSPQGWPTPPPWEISVSPWPSSFSSRSMRDPCGARVIINLYGVFVLVTPARVIDMFFLGTGCCNLL